MTPAAGAVATLNADVRAGLERTVTPLAMTCHPLAQLPPTNVSSYYAVTMATDNTTSPPSFLVTGTPSGKQAQEKCGTLTIDQRGVKTASGTGICW